MFKRPAAAAISGLVVLSGILAGSGYADPADDALAKLNELSRQAEQTTEAIHSAQLELNKKVAAQEAADKAHANAEAALQTARAQLAGYQSAVDNYAVAAYMGGRTDGVNAILTAESPQQMIDTLSAQRLLGADMSTQMDNFRAAGQNATRAEESAATTAAAARTAAENAAAVRAELQSKQSRLRTQIAIVKSQYLVLTPGQRVALAAPGPEAAPDAAPTEQAPPAEGAPAPAPAVDALASLPSIGGGGGGGQAAIAVQAALTQVGTPYSWGGAAPGGFDCSGLVMWAFQQAGIALPHSSQAQANGGQPVSLSDLQPGDVLTFYSDASHSGIYVGDGMMIHSSTYGQPVRVVPMESSGPIHNARRY